MKQRPSTCAACGFSGARGWDACPRCNVWGSALPADAGALRPRGRTRLGDVPDVPIVRLACAEPWRTVLGGGLAAGSTTLIYGSRGCGKTTELVRLAGSLGAGVLFSCLEMGQDPKTLHAVARRTATDAREPWVSDSHTLGELCAEVARAPAPRAFVLDSLSSLARGSEEAALSALRRALPRACAFVAVLHVTKAGAMAGAEDLAHACDTIVRLTPDSITTEGEKNRFGLLATGARPARLLLPE